jgi:hypothetical protein
VSEIKIEDIQLVPVDQLKPNPKNRNKHPESQIKRLAAIINYQGFRQPIIVSNNSGYVVVGHGRLEAARMLGIEEVPVSYQTFKSEDEEYAFAVSDNAIAEWSELDLSGINSDLGDFDPSFDLDMLGIMDFRLDPSERTVEFTAKDGASELGADQFGQFAHRCPKCGFGFD